MNERDQGELVSASGECPQCHGTWHLTFRLRGHVGSAEATDQYLCMVTVPCPHCGERLPGRPLPPHHPMFSVDSIGERRTFPMATSEPTLTTDRQQIRRDAKRTIAVANHQGYYQIDDRIATAREVDLARHCLALLDELEQADQHRRRTLKDWNDEATELRARLANVPALIEAAKRLVEMPLSIVDSGTHDRLRDALNAWDNQ